MSETGLAPRPLGMMNAGIRRLIAAAVTAVGMIVAGVAHADGPAPQSAPMTIEVGGDGHVQLRPASVLSPVAPIVNVAPATPVSPATTEARASPHIRVGPTDTGLTFTLWF